MIPMLHGGNNTNFICLKKRVDLTVCLWAHWGFPLPPPPLRISYSVANKHPSILRYRWVF